MDARPTCGGSHVVKESGIAVPTLIVANWRGKSATSGGDISGAFSKACGETSGFGLDKKGGGWVAGVVGGRW
jgi:hypothetical protein